MEKITRLGLLVTAMLLAGVMGNTAGASPPSITGAGALKTRAGAIEIGLAFDKDLDATTAGDASHYQISKGTISGVRFQQYVHPFGAVAIATTGVADGDTVTITVTGVKDLDGNAMPATTKTLTVQARLTRVNVGGTNYVDVAGGSPADWPTDAVAAGDKDYDLVSGGSIHWGGYDEVSFAYEIVTGDFDKVVRVEYQDPTSQWARAGLMVRAALDEGKTQADVQDNGYLFSRNLNFRVNPAVQASGADGYNAHQLTYRATDGGPNAHVTEDFTPPAYPNAWLRVKREGQKFTGYRGTDGVNWTAVGDYTFVDADILPATVFFGPFYGPTLDDNATKDIVGHSTHMRVHDYGDFVVATSPPSITGVGALKTGAGVIEIGLLFDKDLDATTAGDASHYQISKGTISGVRFQKYIHPYGAVAIATTGVADGDTVTVIVTGVKGLDGTAMPATSKTLTVQARLTRVNVGGTNYVDVAGGSPADWPTDAVAVGDKDYDLVSGGSIHWGGYDEVSFAYEIVTGDFDKVVRVEYQDPTSQWARAGLMVRAALDEGKTQADVQDNGYLFSRNLNFRVNPAVQASGADGYNAHQLTYRATDGGPNAHVTEDFTPPAYPNAWLRVKREGQKFTGYRGTDGVNWTAVGDYTFVDADILPATVFFGPFYGPTLDDNATKDIVGHSTHMRVHNYGDFGVAPPTIRITSVTVTAGTVTITWTGGGTLQSTTSLVPPVTWKDESASGNFSGPATGLGQFFRAKQ
ncbi:MAG: hypothetical protein ABI651_01595 [Verrucomicrobiota bacterium]